MARNICTIEGCCKIVHGRGYCTAHWTRWKRHGDPLGGGTAFGEPARWLERHVSYSGDDCLTWPFAKSSKGYPVIADKRHNNALAHRMMCEKAHGSAPSPRQDVAHSCGNGHLACINPQHLRWATRADNMADRLAHGTSNRGSRSAKAILTDDQVREIRRLRGQMKQRDIGKMFGIAGRTVCKIQLRGSWAWLD